MTSRRRRTVHESSRSLVWAQLPLISSTSSDRSVWLSDWSSWCSWRSPAGSGAADPTGTGRCRSCWRTRGWEDGDIYLTLSLSLSLSLSIYLTLSYYLSEIVTFKNEHQSNISVKGSMNDVKNNVTGGTFVHNWQRTFLFTGCWCVCVCVCVFSEGAW